LPVLPVALVALVIAGPDGAGLTFMFKVAEAVFD